MLVGVTKGKRKCYSMSEPWVESPRHYELEQHTPWFYEEHSIYVDQKRHAELHWLQDSLQINADNLNNV